jgi:hypothetical protein
MGGICTILGETRKVVIILVCKSEGNTSRLLGRYRRRGQETIEIITKGSRK